MTIFQGDVGPWVVAIDPGTRCGWAVSSRWHGAWELWRQPRKGDPGIPPRVSNRTGRVLTQGKPARPSIDDGEPDTRLFRLVENLRRLIAQIPSTRVHVVFEASTGFVRGASAVQVAHELRGALKVFCLEHGYPYTSVEPGELKKFATGKGNATKDEMIEAARFHTFLAEDDDDEADAILLRRWAAEHVSHTGENCPPP